MTYHNLGLPRAVADPGTKGKIPLPKNGKTSEKMAFLTEFLDVKVNVKKKTVINLENV